MVLPTADQRTEEALVRVSRWPCRFAAFGKRLQIGFAPPPGGADDFDADKGARGCGKHKNPGVERKLRETGKKRGQIAA
jgi:hypothetical protein